MTQRYEVSKCCCKNGSKRCGQRRAAPSLQFVKRKNKHRICKVLQNELHPYLPYWRLHKNELKNYLMYSPALRNE